MTDARYQIPSTRYLASVPGTGYWELKPELCAGDLSHKILLSVIDVLRIKELKLCSWLLCMSCLHYCSAVLQVTVQDILGVPIASLARLITTKHLSNTRNTCPKDLGASLHQKIMRAAPLPRKGNVTSNMRCFRHITVTLIIC